MKILFITDNFPPEVNAPANRSYAHCKEWVKSGAEVTVITCAPNFPKGQVFEGYKNKWKQEETIEGIRVIRVWSYITANEGFVKRVMDYMSFSATSFLAGVNIKADVIIATSPQFFTSFTGRWLSFFKRVPWVFEVRDLWPESIMAVGAMKRNLAIRYYEWVEKRLYKQANKIVVVTNTFKEKISEKGINANKISVIKNGADLELYQPQTKDAKLLSELKLEAKKVFGYIGTHGMAHGLDFILDAVEPLQHSHPHLHFLFMGDGAHKQNLVNKAEAMQLKNVTFLNSVAKKEVSKFLSILDYALVNLKKSDTFKTVIPSKIFEAAAMHKPILLGLEGETQEIIETYSAGECFEPENTEAFHKAIEKIIAAENQSVYKMGCDKLANDYDRKKLAERMLSVLKEVAQNK